jgi:hypothetical protein
MRHTRSGKSHQICKIHHNFRATAGFKQARARPVSPADITPQRAHHSNGRCATLRSETKCKRYRGSHPLAVVPVRTEKGVPGDGDALLLYQVAKFQRSYRRRLASSDRRFRAKQMPVGCPALPIAKFQGCKVQAGQTPGIHLKSAGPSGILSL